MLLPDVLTLPLLIMGFAYAAFGGPWIMHDIWPILTPAEFSALGAAFGFLMPVAASMFIVWKYPEAFGAGDVKLLTALGAWTGLSGVSYIILGACFIFGFACLINKKRVGPFGPAIVYAAIVYLLALSAL
jgi:leader peptidase (prepilin peptidase)/N-methyltransferase